MAVGISPRRQGVALTTEQAFNTTQNLLLTQKGVCVSVCMLVCVCVFCCCLLRGHRQAFRSLQLSKWDVNIYDTFSAIWYVWTLSPPDIYLRYLHISITHSSIMRGNRRAIKLKLTIEMCYIFHSVCSEQVKILLLLLFFITFINPEGFPKSDALFFRKALLTTIWSVLIWGST